MMTERAIVISALAQILTLVERRNSCWVTRPTTAMQPAAIRAGATHATSSLGRCQREAAGEGVPEVQLEPYADQAAEQVVRAVSHVHGPHQTEDQR